MKKSNSWSTIINREQSTVLGPQRHGKARDCPAKGCQDGQRPRAPDLIRDTEETRLAQPGRGG